MSPTFASPQDATVGFPRVSGDEPGGNPAVENYLTFSPRERG